MHKTSYFGESVHFRMLSRSAVVKLKAILIIDLIIVGAAVGAYFYLQDQGVIAGAQKPASLVISDFTVTPAEAYVGDTIQISANVTNTGDVDGNATYSLLINGAVKNAVNVTLASQMSQLLEFTDIENSEGNYTVTLGEASGFFIVKEPPPEQSKIVLSDYKATPYETWPDKPVNVTFIAKNPSSEADRLFIRITVDGVSFGNKIVLLEAGASETITLTLNATAEGKHVVMLNSLRGTFTVVKEGFHTLTINRSGGGSKPLPFTLNGQNLNTPYQAVLPVGDYSVSVPTPFNVGTGVLAFTSWSDGSTSPSRSFSLDERFVLVVTYTCISGYASCPSLYTWNGTGYSYITDVSNPGWLGYISHVNSDGTVVFGGGNPYDYVKIEPNLLAEKNGAFDLSLAQQWDELFYLDQTYMLVVDHPIGTEAYTSMTNYLNKGETGKIYTTTSYTLRSPVSAVNEQGQNVLGYIIAKDGKFTPGINGIESTSWNNLQLNKLTLDLGQLKGAPAVKLVITGMVDWGYADTYYKYLELFQAAAAKGVLPDGTQVMPAPYLEVQAANGTWIRAPQERQIPLPSDYNARTFTVDLTGLFPADVKDYKVRFTNFWNVTYDYIGIDTTTQKPTTIQKLTPTSANLDQWWMETNSTSIGAFTRYGDVTPLLQQGDDMFVVGRQGDQVNMQFSTADLAPPENGMVRDYFFVVACWFKDPPGAWGYMFDFTVDPLPFLAMTGYPYTTQEHYPNDPAHIAYLREYNTRIIN
jgi:hypothetical protein